MDKTISLGNHLHIGHKTQVTTVYIVYSSMLPWILNNNKSPIGENCWPKRGDKLWLLWRGEEKNRLILSVIKNRLKNASRITTYYTLTKHIRKIRVHKLRLNMANNHVYVIRVLWNWLAAYSLNLLMTGLSLCIYALCRTVGFLRTPLHFILRVWSIVLSVVLCCCFAVFFLIPFV